MPLAGIPIGALFAMAREAVRREKIEEYRYSTMALLSAQRAEFESEARERGLGRMREITNAQMIGNMTGSSIPVGIMVPRDAGVSRSNVSPFVPQLVASPGSMMAWRK